jgi:hypothetical protein
MTNTKRMVRVILGRHWQAKGANLPKSVRIAKAKSKRVVRPVPKGERSK